MQRSFGDLTISKSVLSGTTAEVTGGAVYATFDSELLIQSSTLHGNSAAVHGGAVYTSYDVDTTIVNSTLSGNTAVAGDGGAAYHQYGGSEPQTIANSTLVRNEAGDNGGALYFGPTEIHGSIIADNTAATNDGDICGPGNFSGSFT